MIIGKVRVLGERMVCEGPGAGGGPFLMKLVSGRRLPPSNCTNKGVTSTLANAVKQEDASSEGVSLEAWPDLGGRWDARKVFPEERTPCKGSVL